MNTFYPSLVYIAGITNAVQAVVTFTAPHSYNLGEIVSFRVSPAYGMFEINNLKSRVIAMDSMTITTEINSSTWNNFTTPVSTIGTTPPCCIPSASGIIPNYYPATMTLLDSFDNIPS